MGGLKSDRHGECMKKLVLKRWMYDFILSICLLAFAAGALIYSYVLESPRVELFLARPDTYLALWLIVLSALSVMLMVRSLRARRTDKGREVGEGIWCGLGVFTVAALLLYLLALNHLGFLLDSILLLWIISGVYTFQIGVKKKNWRDKKVLAAELIKTGVFSLLSSGLTYWIFTNVLSTRLPEFSLF